MHTGPKQLFADWVISPHPHSTIMEDQTNMEAEEQSKENQIRAKQAISPHGLGDQSPEGFHGGPAARLPDEDIPDAPPSELEANYTDEDGQPLDSLPIRHPNRNYDKPGLDKPAYS